MRLLVGLGNPGAKYENTRHNIGFLSVDAIAREHGFSPWRGRFQGQIAEGRLGKDKALLLKPETFMNLSGQSVGEAMRYYRLEPQDVVVFHDELDLAPGKIRVKTGGGHAGHNGLRSMHEHIGADFHRVRIGIGHPGDKKLVSGYVLHDFAKADWEWITPLLDAMASGAARLADGDAPGFMTYVAQKTQPPRPERAPKPKKVDASPARDVRSPRPSDAAIPEAEQATQKTTLSPLQKLVERFSRKD